MQIPNGVIIEPIGVRPTDYLAGVNSPIGLAEVLPSGDWTPYLPSEERQKLKNGDTFACVSFSALNSLETQFNFLIATKQLTIEQITFLNDFGFMDANNKVNFSDRYTAKMSGTIKGKGNSLYNVANSIRHDGLLPEKDYPSVDNVDGYYAEIPQNLKDKAKEIKKYFEFNYEWIFSDFEQHLKQAPLQIATAVCSGWGGNEIIQKCDLPVSHATLVYHKPADFIHDFDSYPPFYLKLASDYKLPWVLKILINQLTTKKPMRYVKVKVGEKIEQYLLEEWGALKLAHNIGDEIELADLVKQGLTGIPEELPSLPEGYVIYPLVKQERFKNELDGLRSGFNKLTDLIGLNK